MKFAIISDTHDNFANLKKALLWIQKEKIDIVLHCGDICRKETIDDAQKIFKGPSSAKGFGEAKEIKFVKGNGDFGLDDIPEAMELLLGDKKIFFNHYPDISKKMAQTGNYDLVFYGHTHRPWMEDVGKCKLVNPGELAGQRYKPTFAVYDTKEDKLELKILEQL